MLITQVKYSGLSYEQMIIIEKYDMRVICHGRWVLSEGHKYYFKDWCLTKSQPIFLFLTYLNSVNYGHIIKMT